MFVECVTLGPNTELRRKESAMSDNTETAILAGGCFWGVEELLRRRDGVISTGSDTPAGRTTTRPTGTILVTPRRSRSSSTPSGSPTGTSSSSSSRSTTRRPRTARATTRLQLPLRDLLLRATSSARSPRTRSPTSKPQAVARQGRDRDQRGRPVLGGRARAPGLPPALPGRLHLPLPAAGLEAATPRDRGLTAAGATAPRC